MYARVSDEALRRAIEWVCTCGMAAEVGNAKAFIMLRIIYILSPFHQPEPYKKCCKMKPQTSL